MPKRIVKRDGILWLPGYPFEKPISDPNAITIFETDDPPKEVEPSYKNSKSGRDELKRKALQKRFMQLTANRERFPLEKWGQSYTPTKPNSKDVLSSLLW